MSKFSKGQTVRVVGNNSDGTHHYLPLGATVTVDHEDVNDREPGRVVYFVETVVGNLGQYVSEQDLEPTSPFEVIAETTVTVEPVKSIRDARAETIANTVGSVSGRYDDAAADAQVLEELELGDKRTLALLECAKATLHWGFDVDQTTERLVTIVHTSSSVEQKFIAAVVRYAEKRV